MTDAKKTRPLEPETAVKRIRRRHETETARLEQAEAEVNARFWNAEVAWQKRTLGSVPEALREPARAMLKAIGIDVPAVIDGEFAEAEDIPLVDSTNDAANAPYEESPPVLPAWTQEPPKGAPALVVDRSVAKK